MCVCMCVLLFGVFACFIMLVFVRRYCIVYFKAEFYLILQRRYIFHYESATLYRLFFVLTGYSIMKESPCRQSALYLLQHKTVNLFLSLGCHLFIRWVYPFPRLSHSLEKWRTQNVVYLPCAELNNPQVTTVYLPLTPHIPPTTK